MKIVDPISNNLFPRLPFRGELRPSQRNAIDIAAKKLGSGARRLHIVAPPGSGKTILGLYLWAELVRRPALVLSPNSAIQAQWIERAHLFGDPRQDADRVSSDPERLALLTSLTYQSITIPQRGDDDLNGQARTHWIDRLLSKGRAQTPTEAGIWIDDLQRKNPAYYEQRLSVYRKEIRDAEARGGEALKRLHESAAAILGRLRDRRVGLLILDECHHLLGHWGRVLSGALEQLDHPVVVGLTATPPDRDGKHLDDVKRYDDFFGPVDYEVPVPAIVKDGFLAPYQDLAYFVRPSPDELRYLANVDAELDRLVDDLCRPREQRAAAGDEQPESLIDWLRRVLAERMLPSGQSKDWNAFERRDPEFAKAARWFLVRRGIEMPPGVPEPLPRFASDRTGRLDILVPVIDRFVRHRLRGSSDPEDHKLAETAAGRLRMLGFQITEHGSRPCASPVSRILAYSREKAAAIIPILRAERATLGERIRAVVVADFEKSSAVSSEVEDLLSSEAGGAVAAFRTLLTHPDTDALDPVLLTGSSVLVDDDLRDRFEEAARQWLAQAKVDVELSFLAEEGFHVLVGRGSDWCPRVYVAMVTDLFQRGITRCLVGTRGLLGEGWDADKINVLIDLSTVTTSMSTNQLRGRSIRLDALEPQKLADNWDVVCIAGEFSKGLDDYARFRQKHECLFGATEDGAVEKGVGHVHASLTDLRPEGIERSVEAINGEMLSRVGRRPDARLHWKIGNPYQGLPIVTTEVSPLAESESGAFPPFSGQKSPWTAASLTMAVGNAVLGALREAGLVTKAGRLQVRDRAGGYARIFWEGAPESDSRLFSESLAEAFDPLAEPRYVIPRQVDFRYETALSRRLPAIVARFFRRRKREMVVVHAVPSALAKNKELVDIYERYWNAYVSPGRALFSQRGEGKEFLRRAAAAGRTPTLPTHRKEVFL